jgi:hypothetical protein
MFWGRILGTESAGALARKATRFALAQHPGVCTRRLRRGSPQFIDELSPEAGGAALGDAVIVGVTYSVLS